jgi:hypothetical protein
LVLELLYRTSMGEPMRVLPKIFALCFFLSVSHVACQMYAQVPAKSRDSVKAVDRAAVQLPDSTKKAMERAMPHADSTGVKKSVERSSAAKTLGRETAPYAPKNAGKVKKNQPTTR